MTGPIVEDYAGIRHAIYTRELDERLAGHFALMEKIRQEAMRGAPVLIEPAPLFCTRAEEIRRLDAAASLQRAFEEASARFLASLDRGGIVAVADWHLSTSDVHTVSIPRPRFECVADGCGEFTSMLDMAPVCPCGDCNTWLLGASPSDGGECEACGTGGWECYAPPGGLGPGFRECSVCGNPHERRSP